jgi:hypothetical protein
MPQDDNLLLLRVPSINSERTDALSIQLRKVCRSKRVERMTESGHSRRFCPVRAMSGQKVISA